MTLPPPPRPKPHKGAWTLVVLVALALAAPVDAQTMVAGHLVATKVTAESGNQTGSLRMLHTGRYVGSVAPAIQVQGATLSWTQAEQVGPAVNAAGTVVAPSPGDPSSLGQEPQRETDHHATYQSTTAQPQYTVHLYAASPLQLSAQMDAFGATAVQRPHLSPDRGITEWAPGDAATQEAPAWDFAQFDVPSPMVVTVPDGTATLTVEGDFILEMRGVNGTIAGDLGSRAVASGRWNQPMHPAAGNPVLYEEHNVFLRIWVTDGSATFTFGADATTQWAGQGAGYALAGKATFESATGAVTTESGQEVAVNAASYTLDGRHDLQMVSEPSGLDIQLRGYDADGNPLVPGGAAVQRVPEALLAGIALVIVVLAAVAGAAWLAQRRLRHEPTMADVEAALEAGQFRRAAREAGRILRHKPGMETAVISRAIALSKAGRNARVVTEVEDHLKQSDPTDGVLHYVLGVAYSDLGQPAAAEAAFQEALTRTPDLLPEVRSRLPAGSRIPAPSKKAPAETHGYA